MTEIKIEDAKFWIVGFGNSGAGILETANDEISAYKKKKEVESKGNNRVRVVESSKENLDIIHNEIQAYL